MGEIPTLLTPRKRSSSILLDLPFSRPLPIPDGFIGVADRYQLGGKYSPYEDIYSSSSSSIETLIGLSSLLLQSLENLSSGDFISSAGSANIEFLITVSPNSLVNTELLTKISQDLAGDTETLGSTITVSRDDSLSIETIITRSSSNNSPIENLLGVSSRDSSPTENIFFLSSIQTSSMESAINTALYLATNNENLLGLSSGQSGEISILRGISSSVPISEESIITFLTTKDGFLESSILTGLPSVLSVEGLIGIPSKGLCLLEIKSDTTLTIVMVGNVEILTNQLPYIYDWVPGARVKIWTLNERGTQWTLPARPDGYTLDR